MDRTHPEGSLSDEETARRLHVPELPRVAGAEVELGADAAQHARVLRLRIGDPLQLFDGRGGTAAARLVSLERRSLRCSVVDAPRFVMPGPRVVLVQCLPKAGKLDDIVRMTTEIGVACIALAIAERCVARAGKEEHRLGRLERIALEAARQSEQPFVPELRAPRPLAEVLATAPESAFRAACVERATEALPGVVSGEELWLVVGPEGGLSPRDRAELAEARFMQIALGRSILRTETAAVVGVVLALERLQALTGQRR